jgi:Concanavalin A-like lectin/glucanases superfamily
MKTLYRYYLPVFLLGGLLNGSSCTKAKYDDSFTKAAVPPIGTYKNSNDVAAANLLAHWSFDTTNEESISHTAPTGAVNATFVPGIKGNALHLNAGYVLYPVISALNVTNLGSVTVSMWINVDNNGTQASSFFALTPGPTKQTDWGSVINVYAETGHPVATDDTLALHVAVGSYASGSRNGGDNINDYGNREQDFKTVHGTNKWVHYVLKYDGAASTLDIYANSVLVSNNNFRVRTGLGPLVSPVPVQVLLGAFPNAATGFPLSGKQDWQALLTGSIDEIRVYNTALSDADIHALYFFERLGS